MRAIVWQPTRRCNFSCPYCQIYVRPQEFKTGYTEEPDWKKWLEIFNRLKPQTLDITGGEPFLMAGLVDFIEALHPDIKLGMTSNLTKPILEFVKRIPASRLVNFTLSYHPTQKLNRDEFFGKMLLLKSKGFPICVNFVAFPEQMYLIPYLEYEFRNIGVRFHVDPYHQAGCDIPKYEFSEVEKKWLNRYVKEDRSFRLNGENKEVLCSGGVDYLMILPDGTAHRCMFNNLTKKEAIGNVFDEGFSLLKEYKPCSFSNECGGCDRDKVTIKEL
jgi:MoaA/NifB/PqqE/SkfB family radical SAM enzyme